MGNPVGRGQGHGKSALSGQDGPHQGTNWPDERGAEAETPPGKGDLW